MLNDPTPVADSQGKKEIKRYRRNHSVDSPEEPKPKLHDATGQFC